VKVKVIASEGFFIIGYERSAAALGGIGRLLLAAKKDGVLTYVGGVGTGFTAASGAALRKAMDKLVVECPVVDMGRKKRPEVTWLRPELVAEVEFRAWTTDQKLRHSSFKGLREKADAADVYEIE
jgi:bifunctional non-homologous end joining protein LigD